MFKRNENDRNYIVNVNLTKFNTAVYSNQADFAALKKGALPPLL
jgi:hypothetical protein